MRFHSGLALSLLAACSSGRAGGGDDDDGDGGTGVPIDAAIGECVPAAAGAFTFEKIATWLDDAQGAYSMIHDDMCGPQLFGIEEQAVPALNARGLKAGVAPIAGICEDSARWDTVLEAERHGHEIVSHSFSHETVTAANAQHEIVDAKALFDAHIANPITFFVFPYDHFTPETVAVVQSSGHLGCRAGIRDDNDGFMMPPINPPTPTGDYAVEFDVWPRAYSKYALYFPEDMLTIHAYQAIERGGWAMREFHSVVGPGMAGEGQGFGPITIAEYERHLDFLRAARDKGVLWTAAPTTVLRYRHARTACRASVSGDTITYDTSSPECVKYATPISVIVTTADDLARVDGTQAGAPVMTKKLGARRFSITADPTLGPVTLAGCSNPGYAIDPDIALAPKPVPAESVCLIESVTGTGSPGKMDDLERDPALLQVLPNPSQGDGRNGTWSWYPQNAQVTIAPDGGGRALRYSGSGLNAWSGATLAFLGGNGAGTCYDATSYTGIRFKLKGTVTSSDELDGKLIVSLVTSETQSRLYGGDLDGEGGHFNKVVPVSAAWTTVQIPFAELNRPTWGATASLTAPARKKLQAIDWGVSNLTSRFEIWIDDVELY